MLDNRKKRILQAIIEEYIQTAEPVSSGMLSKKYDLNISSATIRNEMAELEYANFLDKPHTSSGRVPSGKGYRYYVNELLKDNNITKQEMQYIKLKLEQKVNEIEDLTKIATSTLSELTHYTSLAIGGTAISHNIEDIKFVLLGNRVLMAVILTDGGLIKETIIKFNADITEEQVRNINQIFNANLRGKSLAKIDKPMEEYIVSEMNYELQIIRPIIEQINEAILQNDDIYLEGTNRIFEMPEFKSYETARNFLNVIDTKGLVKELLNTGQGEEIHISIGDENQYIELKNLSLITFKNIVEGKEMGTIGIIGPTRMDYSKVVSIIKYMLKELND